MIRGMFFEGWINSVIPFLSYRDVPDSRFRKHGVSRFEATLRAEPVYAVWNSQTRFDWNPDGAFAVLGALGFLMHYFPAVQTEKCGKKGIDYRGNSRVAFSEKNRSAFLCGRYCITRTCTDYGRGNPNPFFHDLVFIQL